MARILPDGVVVHVQGKLAPAVHTIPKINKRVLPNWHLGFLEYTSEAESPAPYLLWSGLFTVAAAAQRKIWMETAYFSVHSNMYVVLTGPAGSKKSTAIDQGRKLLREVPEIHFTTSATSVAALIQQFTAISAREHQSLTAHIRELASLLAISQEEMVDFLTDIYDGSPDWDKQTRAHSKEKIAFPWMHMITGTTPEWLGENFTRTAVQGGFAARTLFVFSKEMVLKSPWPRETAEQKVLKRQLINDLTYISQLRGQFDFTPEAMSWYDTWYRDKRRFPTITDARTAGYFVRKPIHVLKVAMALALSRRDDLLLTLDDLTLALAFLDLLEPGMHEAFSAVGGNIYANDLERIESQIIAHPQGISYKALIRANYHAVDKFNLDRILDSLVAMGAVERVLGTVPGGYYHARG